MPTHGGQKETKERQTTPDQQVAVFIGKETYKVSLGSHKTRGFRTHPPNLKSLYRGLLASVMYTVQMFPTTANSLKVVSLKMVPTMGMVGRKYISRTREVEEPQTALHRSRVNLQSCLLDDLLKQA